MCEMTESDKWARKKRQRSCLFLVLLHSGDDVDDFETDALLSFHGSSTNVGSGGDHGMVVQSLVGGGFVSKDVQTGGVDLAGLESGEESGFVDVGTAGGVDDHNAVLHLGNALGIDEGAAVNSGSVDGDEVGLSEQFVHLNVGDTQLLFDAGDVEDVEGDNVHADGLGHDSQALTDAAVTDNAEGLAGELDALAVAFFSHLSLRMV